MISENNTRYRYNCSHVLIQKECVPFMNSSNPRSQKVLIIRCLVLAINFGHTVVVVYCRVNSAL